MSETVRLAAFFAYLHDLLLEGRWDDVNEFLATWPDLGGFDECLYTVGFLRFLSPLRDDPRLPQWELLLERCKANITACGYDYRKTLRGLL